MTDDRNEPNVIGFAYDELTDNVKSQIVRDLLILLGTWDVSVLDPKHDLSDSLLSQLGVCRVDADPTLVLVYRTGEDWPVVDSGVKTVKRDLKPSTAKGQIDTGEHVGYYLRPQGRDGSNRTEMYLNRAYPKGVGIVDPLVTLIWG